MLHKQQGAESKKRVLLLVPKPPLFSAVRTLPRDGIARHTPEILFHTLLADLKTATTVPAERRVLTADVAVEFLFPPSPALLFLFLIGHLRSRLGICYRELVIR